MKCKCGGEMVKLKDNGIRYFVSRFQCGCGIKLEVIWDFDETHTTDLYTWIKDDEILEVEEI